MSSLLNRVNPVSINDKKLPVPTSFGNISSSIVKPTVIAPLPSLSLIISKESQSATPDFIAKDIPGESASTPATSSAPGFTVKDANQSSSRLVTLSTPSTTAPGLPNTSNPSFVSSTSTVSSTSVVSAISPVTTSIISSTPASTPQSLPTTSSAVVPTGTPPSQNPPAVGPAQPQDQNTSVSSQFTAKGVPSPLPSPIPAPSPVLSPVPSPNSSPAPSSSPSPAQQTSKGVQAFSAAAIGPLIEPSRAPPGQASSPVVIQSTSAANPQSVEAAVPPPVAKTSDAASASRTSAIVPDAVTITPIPEISSAASSPGGIITTIGLGGANDQSGGRQLGNSGSGSAPSGTGSDSDSSGSGSRPPVAAIVGGTIGGIAAVSLLVLLFWLWRKRGHRRRIPLTPTGEGPIMEKRFGRDPEPTTQGLGLGGMMGFVGKTFGKGSKSTPDNGVRGVDMNRGNSQFLEAVTIDASNNSGPAHGGFSFLDRNGREDFRGGHGLSISTVSDFNPFSDANAVPSDVEGTSARHSSRISLSNPFADSNMILPPPASAPTTSERRSRGQSFGGLRSFQGPTVVPRPHSVLRESLASNDSFEECRDKFRSDPFDLELGSRLIPTADNIAQMPQRTDTRRTSSQYSTQSIQHARPDSFTSRYTSGASLGEWGDPGPDISLVMKGRGDSPTITNDELRRFGERARRQGGRSPLNTIQVGQAL